MKSGPKPLTPALRLLRGSRKRPRHAVLPRPKRAEGAAVLEEVPSWSERRDMAEVLGPEARRIWQQVIRPLNLPVWQWVTAIQYCTSLSRWHANLQVLQQEGDVLENEITHSKYAHPLVKIVKDLTKELDDLRGQLGLGMEREAEAESGSGKDAGAVKPKARFFT